MTLELTKQEAEVIKVALSNHLEFLSSLHRLSHNYPTCPVWEQDFKYAEKFLLGLNNRFFKLLNGNPQQSPSGEVQGEASV